ncbi:unnamed protein product [Cladocopium goreaui]|uniref:DNA (Cytosine-5)-methyltransferase 3A n=1 Tax=Cladocopium goreaui TaxID=2562237 RepID=A0A9P1CW90_9DINO|nr:unnamed protein product [Cladocopium goreaui]
MSMTGRWLIRLAIDAQGARDAVMPSHADSPAIMYALVTMATALMKWSTWEGTPIGQLAPNLCLFINVVDRLAVMALGAFCMPDMNYLNSPQEVTPHGLAIEAQSIQEFNRKYVQTKLDSATPSPHWKAMWEELVEEKAKGRVEAPLQAPADWKVTLQEVRLGRRSSHNSTIEADDCPHYNDVEGYATAIRHLQSLSQGKAMIWGQDLAGAYRQLPVKPGDDTYTILMVPEGPSLWRHRAAPFGAVASVWAFCRFGDSLTALARRLLLTLTGHFVDDWTGTELAATCRSSCDSFRDFFLCLGLAMKPEKEQPPALKQKVLGVIMSVQQEALTVEICPKRRDRLVTTLNKILESNHLTPDEAQLQVAGKLGFMSTTLFGGTGMAAIQPFHSRAHCLGEQKNNKLTFVLRAAINTLLQLLSGCRPRTFPWTTCATATEAVI